MIRTEFPRPDMSRYRVAVPLSPEAYEATGFLSKVSGKSRGRILADMLEEAIPALMTIAEAHKAAQEVEEAQRAEIRARLASGEEKLLGALSDALSDLSDDTEGGRS
jgi:hypothetical protein